MSVWRPFLKGEMTLTTSDWFLKYNKIKNTTILQIVYYEIEEINLMLEIALKRYGTNMSESNIL